MEKIKSSTADFLTAADVAPVIGAHPQNIRTQAQADPDKLGFPVSVIGNRVRIPRLAFIKWVEGGKL